MRWIEIPAQRILEIIGPEREAFDWYQENGEPCANGSIIYMAVRKSDGKRFRAPAFIPAGAWQYDAAYLMEW